jgi:alanine dehydrogenase
MSEIAGKLAVQNGATHLLAQHGGRGVLLGGAVGVSPAQVVILGAGIAGRAACEIALGFGARVTILDIDHKKLAQLKAEFGNAPTLLFSTSATIAREVSHADLLIGAVLIPGAAAPKLVNENMVQSMKSGSVIVDISVDQGGCITTTKVTSLQNPTETLHGVIHYGVPNMPAQTPRTSTLALTAATLPYIIQLANGGEKLVLNNPVFSAAVNTYNGHLVQAQVAQALNLKANSLDSML